MCTTKKHESPEDLIKNFFEYYSDNEKHPITLVEEFKKQMNELKNYVFEKIWNKSESEKYYACHDTYFCESKFSTALKFLPKTTLYKKNYKTRCKLLDLHWDQSHISREYKAKYGQQGIKIRKNFKERILSLNFEN